MSGQVVRMSERAPAARVEDYLGPAEVTRVEGPAVWTILAGGAEVRAELALAFPYEPAQGDTLLVIGKGQAHYVIGVLRGTGKSALCLPGDVALHAGGALRLSADKGVSIRGEEVHVEASKLRMTAESVVQSFRTMLQRVSDVLSVHARKSHTLVEEGMYTQSKSAAIVTQETVTINGNEVHLG